MRRRVLLWLAVVCRAVRDRTDADINREKAEKVGLTPTDVFSTLQVYLGSQYVNDFNLLGRTYEVIVQADGEFRKDHADISRLKVRNSFGEMVPIGTVAQMKDNTIPYRVPRYNVFPAAEVQGVAAPGVGIGHCTSPHGGTCSSGSSPRCRV